MCKIIFMLLVALVASVAAKPGYFAAAPLANLAAFPAAYTAYAAPFGYATPFTVAPLDAFSSSYRLDNFFTAPKLIAAIAPSRYIAPTSPFAAYATAPGTRYFGGFPFNAAAAYSAPLVAPSNRYIPPAAAAPQRLIARNEFFN